MHDGLDGLGSLDDVFWGNQLGGGLLLRQAAGHRRKVTETGVGSASFDLHGCHGCLLDRQLGSCVCTAGG
jgi:hypothetical protein